VVSRNKILPLGFLLILASLPLAGVPARADDDAIAVDSGDNEAATAEDDVALGELGSSEDDEQVPRQRRVARQAPAAAPRVVTDSSVRTALVHRFSSEFSAEIYSRGAASGVTDPLTTRGSRVAAGIIGNRSFGSLVWSSGVEVSQHYRDFFDQQTFSTTEFSTALARAVKLGGPLSVTPRVAVDYSLASDTRFSRVKFEWMAPLTYKVSKQLDLIFTPRLDWQVYTDRPDNRRDVTGYFGLGLKYEVAKGVSLAAAVGYETRSSNTPRADFVRWKLAPQLSLRKEL